MVKDVILEPEVKGFLRRRHNHRRLTVFHHKGLKCCYCDKKGKYLIRCVDKTGNEHVDLYTDKFILMTVDHVLPKSKGGTRELKNLVPACRKCNSSKSNQPTWFHTICVWKLNVRCFLNKITGEIYG
jgi:5-methylcytosine-specific restriction endonuclease McrA